MQVAATNPQYYGSCCDSCIVACYLLLVAVRGCQEASDKVPLKPRESGFNFAILTITVVKVMMTREQIKEIVSYSQEHGITVKQRLRELSIPEATFYYAKRMYAREDMVPGEVWR